MTFITTPRLIFYLSKCFTTAGNTEPWVTVNKCCSRLQWCKSCNPQSGCVGLQRRRNMELLCLTLGGLLARGEKTNFNSVSTGWSPDLQSMSHRQNDWSDLFSEPNELCNVFVCVCVCMCVCVCVCVRVHNAYVLCDHRKEREGERERETKTESEGVREKSLSLLKCQEKTLFILHFIWRYKVVSSTQHFSVFLPGKSPVLFLWGEMMPVRWEGKQTFWFGLYCSTAARSMFLPRALAVCCFAVSRRSLRELKKYQTPEFQAGNIGFHLLLLALPLSAELRGELNLQASQLFQTLWSTEVETCEESGWLTLHSPAIHSHQPCSLLPAEGEERTAEAWLLGRGYYGVSVTVRRETPWLKGWCLLS